jgi:hypothetical protein
VGEAQWADWEAGIACRRRNPSRDIDASSCGIAAINTFRIFQIPIDSISYYPNYSFEYLVIFF